MKSPLLSVCIISNVVDAKLLKVIKSFRHPRLEICIGFNQLSNEVMQAFKKDHPYVKVYSLEWKGYGPTKNELATFANSDWILSVDSDEIADKILLRSILRIRLDNIRTIFSITRKYQIGTYNIQFGAYGKKEIKDRIYNKKLIRWDQQDVHETLILPSNIKRVHLYGTLWHYTVESFEELREKNDHYAQLSAEHKFKAGKTARILTPFLSGSAAFLKNYFLKLGFLNGRIGWELAKETARYTALKYKFLQELQQKGKN